MSHFRPSRVSPPLRTPTGPSLRVPEFTDISQPPTVPELVGLSAKEIDFIDEVIGRAPATASTFLTVFKAYNDVLQERGLDPQNEVVYYGKLLKIGTLKGKNWADKWNVVKEQQGYIPKAGAGARGGRTTRVSRTTSTPSPPSAVAKVPCPPREPDTFTLHSHQEDTGGTQKDPVTKLAASRGYPNMSSHDTPRPVRRFGSTATTVSSNSLGLDTGPTTETNPSDFLRRLVARARTATTPRWDAETSETHTQVSSVPPSYGAAVRDEVPAIPYKDKGKGREMPLVRRFGAGRDSSAPIHTQPLPNQSPPRQQRERRVSAVNAEEAFRRVKEAQDEEIAARFYNDRLVERCYEVWKQGYEWIVVGSTSTLCLHPCLHGAYQTTSEQIAEARNSLILRRALLAWRNRNAQRREVYLRVAALSDRRCLKQFYRIWQQKNQERRHHRKQLEWREDMRIRMKTVRERGELRLKNDMWAKWRQSYLSHLAEWQFSRKVAARFFNKWKARLRKLDELEAAADYFEHDQDEKLKNHLWDAWRHRTELRHGEKVITTRANLRIMTHAIDLWRRSQ